MRSAPSTFLRWHQAPARPYARGFTLIELMIVVTLMAIMLGLAAPSFRDFVAGQRVKTAAGEYASSLVQARSEAIKRNADVTVTPSAGGWADGWTVAGAGATVGTQNAYTGLTFTCVVTASHPTCPTPVITYKGTGRLSVTVPWGKMQVTSAVNATSMQCVAIDLSGMPVTTKGGCT